MPKKMALHLGEVLHPQESFTMRTGDDVTTHRLFFATSRIEELAKSYHAMLLLAKNGFERPVEAELKTFINQLIHFNTEILRREKKSADVDGQEVFEAVFSELFRMSEVMGNDLNVVQRERMVRLSHQLKTRVMQNDFKAEISKANDEFVLDDYSMWPTVIVGMFFFAAGISLVGGGVDSAWGTQVSNWITVPTTIGAGLIGALAGGGAGGLSMYYLMKLLRSPHRYDIKPMKDTFSRCFHLLGRKKKQE